MRDVRVVRMRRQEGEGEGDRITVGQVLQGDALEKRRQV